MAPAERKRLLDIDRAKGLGILLVVWGHLFKAGTFNEAEWLQISRVVTYSFHMPLFMYLSGFVYFFTKTHIRILDLPLVQIAKRFDRLMVPFVAFGLLVTIGKYAASSFGPIDDKVTDIPDGLLKIVLNTPDNPSISIWYLLVVFVYSVVTPFLWRATGGRIAVLLVLAALLWLAPAPDAFYLRRICIYYIFFVVGGYAAMNWAVVQEIFRRGTLPFLALFAAACFVFYMHPLALLLCGLASIPAIHGLFLQPIWERDRVLLLVGSMSMVIYLFNTIFIGVAKIVWPRLLPYDGSLYLPFVLFVFLAGAVGPMIVKLCVDRMPLPERLKTYLN